MGALTSTVSAGVPLMEALTTTGAVSAPPASTVVAPGAPGPTCGNAGVGPNLQPVQAILLFAIAFGIGVFLALLVHFRTMVTMCRGCGRRGRGSGVRPRAEGEQGAAEEGSGGRPPDYEMALTMPRPQRTTNVPCLTPVFVIAGPSNAGTTSVEEAVRAEDPPSYDTVIRQLAVNLSPLGRVRVEERASYISARMDAGLEDISESPECPHPPTSPRPVAVNSASPGAGHRHHAPRAPRRTAVRTTRHGAREDRYNPMDLIAVHTWF